MEKNAETAPEKQPFKPPIKDLKEAMKISDVESFLYYYLTWMKESNSITVPTTLDEKRLLIEWPECLPTSLENPSEEFIKELSEYWIKVAQKLQSATSMTLAEELISIIRKEPYQKQKPIPKKQGISTRISRDYQESIEWNPFKILKEKLFGKKTKPK